MRRPELDYILSSMLESQPEVSDLLFTVDKPFQVEAYGELKPVAFDPPIEKLTPFQTEMIALNLIGENQWHFEDLLRRVRARGGLQSVLPRRPVEMDVVPELRVLLDGRRLDTPEKVIAYVDEINRNRATAQRDG